MGKLQPQAAEGAALPPVRAAAAPAAVREEGGVPPMALVAVIALLVGLVSLPRFRAHVVRANRADAPVVLGLLAAQVNGGDAIREAGGPETLFQLIQDTRSLRHRLRDARALAIDPQVVDHHGYLYATGRIQAGGGPRPALVAWPLRFGETGDHAYAIARDGVTYVHSNGGLWSGADRALMDVDLQDERWIPTRKGIAGAD